MLMSVLGLIEGLCSTLPITVSLYGLLDFENHPTLCPSMVVLQGHVIVVYIVNSCNVALEVGLGLCLILLGNPY